jgi:hypothetical protein
MDTPRTGIANFAFLECAAEYCDEREKEAKELKQHVEAMFCTLNLRCHPDFHSYPWERRPWHNWVMLNWEMPTRSYHQAAKLLLWARFTESTTGVSKLKCAVHSLAGASPKKDKSLAFFNGDKIETTGRVIPAEFVLSVAYVLPSIEEPSDPFPESVEDATYFIVVPPRSTWMEHL